MNDTTPSKSLMAPVSEPPRGRRPTAPSRHVGTTTNKALKPLPLNIDQSIESDGFYGNALRYHLDFWQRSIMFCDVLRQRANNMLEHERAGMPPLLDFEYETLLDGRVFDPPANYGLLRIITIGDDCLEDCLDETKPPVVIIDPRAGHGPGIGGFKRDSEVGIALHEGHAVYFVVFYPEPCHGQTLANVLHALRSFVEYVSERHDGTPPILYGNCQAGWAATLLAADCQGLTGPVVLNGSPLSYWGGEPGVNPMRLAGGLLGGAWPVHFLADLGDGTFDGAWLVQNFESLKPESAIWDKYANLFANVDSESERFLEFERWWNGFYMLSREEITAIVEDLFIGNNLEKGKVRVCPGCYVDLKQIRNPLVIFASQGDNITPPHQALGWVPAVYTTTEDLKKAGQRIIYLLNPHVGHLGIFVSAKVARLEHRAILESLAEIEALPPGLYEMKIDNPTNDPDCQKPQYEVHFEERRIEDLDYEYPQEAFERVGRVSEFNETMYSTFVSPWVQAAANPFSSKLMKWMHPARTSRYLWSEKINPWMAGVAALASIVEQNREKAPPESTFREMERMNFERIFGATKHAREARDQFHEQTFDHIYGSRGAME